MADRHTEEQRSYNMSRIKGANTKPEILLRKRLFAEGFRYRINDKKLPGKPDIVLKKYRTVIFVNGCFWHGHQNCKYFVIPNTRTEFWMNKINGNIDRDLKNEEALIKLGWKVITVWECDLKKTMLEDTVQRITDRLLTSSL
ncbi:very short patch repair endonuclease [Kaistella sp. DKR-2]|uniref:very short patch repair endonuclease n=1 Tax=Kaistella soli TaxID=2849654 RepID=UPI001C279AD8|nr:very short patch repair endonuclease [Kaistella soli]MBU8882315.1 very short patch repair endonuclease [Kaistella soli]